MGIRAGGEFLQVGEPVAIRIQPGIVDEFVQAVGVLPGVGCRTTIIIHG
jgi:hypothetical protein